MQTNLIKYTTLIVCCLFATYTQAGTVYVTDKLETGLHEKSSMDSPVTKQVVSGAELSVIERVNDFVHVQEPGGAAGWISNKYLMQQKPVRIRVSELEEENKILQQEMALLKSKNEALAATPDIENNPDTENDPDIENSLEEWINNWKYFVIAGLFSFILAMLSGAGIFDHFNRRRHGGFRI